jgi:hypothetical protein
MAKPGTTKKTPPSTAKQPAAKKQKQPTQRTPFQRVMVVGPTGKRHFEWRHW